MEKTQELEETIKFKSNDERTVVISRKLMDQFKGSWFHTHFGSEKSIIQKPCDITEKKNKPIYMINVPHHVLEAFIQLMTLPELFDAFTVRRDFIEWELCLAFVEWIFEKHEHIQAFLDQGLEFLTVVMPENQAITFNNKDVLVKDILGGNAERRKRIIKSIERIITHRHDVFLTLETLECQSKASEVWNGYHAYRNIDRKLAWPVNEKTLRSLAMDTPLIILSFKWKDWDGSSF